MQCGNLFILILSNLVFGADLLLLIENLPLAHIGELLCEKLSLCDTIGKDQVDHAYIRIEDGLEKDTTLDALNRDLPSDLFDGNVMGNLDQKVRVGL